MTFEQSKRWKAIGWTVGLHALLLLILFSIKYTTYTAPQLDEFELELVANLGTSDNGFGIDQPEMMGDPAPPEMAAPADASPNEVVTPTPPTPTETRSTEIEETPHIDAKEIPTPTADIPVVKKVEKPVEKKAVTVKPDVATKSKKEPKETPKTEPVVKTEPKPKATTSNSSATNGTNTSNNPPKYTFQGSNGTGGNGASRNVAGGNQGIGTGDGDMGTPGGNPKGLSYSGGVAGRKMVSKPDNQGEFSEGGTVKVKVWVDRDGKITRHQIISAGNSAIRAIAEDKIRAIKFNSDADVPPEQNGIIIFNFKKR